MATEHNGHDHHHRPDAERVAAASERWHRAAHAMQTGVASEMALGSQQSTPKHLRVGMNTALRDHASLVELLIRKGVITEVEYVEAIADGMETEVRDYERRLSEATGTRVTLG